MELSRNGTADGLAATVRDVRISGALVKVELLDAHDAVIHVDLAREQYDRLHLQAGEKVVVTPKRLRVFTSD